MTTSRPEDLAKTREWEADKGSGQVLHVAKVPHSCQQPDILTFGPVSDAGIPTIIRNFPTGSVWQCGCGIVWVVRWRAPYSTRYMHFAGSHEWDRESRRERRRRLGLRWWQREAR